MYTASISMIHTSYVDLVFNFLVVHFPADLGIGEGKKSQWKERMKPKIKIKIIININIEIYI